jgi:uncharacterized protein YyaL (SSP411 family)
MTGENRLRYETSPYLLQHADNPVHWQPWGAAALEQARSTGRPILLSIGYAACHWCHVMAHESFEDPDTAALMNARFVCIKVDREERPDIDQLYMTALHALGEPGGWPLTMFLDPAGAPFWGGTYFPPTPRYGRPSFQQVLNGISDAYGRDRDDILRNTTALTQLLARQSVATPGLVPDDAELARLADGFLRLTDPEHGGLSGAPKFPNPAIFRFLWQFGIRHQHKAMRDAVHLLLTRMTRGGIYDQLGGGYARYSTDAIWLAPHFEKMLYDNAQILELLAFAQVGAPRALYAQAAEATVGWLLRDMQAEPRAGDAAFAASEDADSEGEEGRFYVWDAAEVQALLGPRAAEFARAYDVTEGGNWEGHSILRWVLTEDAPDDFAPDRALLLAERGKRVRPARDDKVLADWNGLAIAALARAAGVFDRPAWLGAAQAAYRFVRRELCDASGASAHAWRQGRVAARGLLEDQACMARAALALFEATGTAAYLADARAMVAEATRLFAAPDGGFYMTSAEADDVPLGEQVRPRFASDNATPAGNGLMAEVLARLYHLTGNDADRRACEAVIATFAGAPNGLGGAPTLAAGAHLLAHGGCVVVGGDPAAPQTQALLRFARAHADPSLCILAAGMGAETTVPAPPAGAPAAHVCRAQTCSRPVTTVSALAALLEQDDA